MKTRPIWLNDFDPTRPIAVADTIPSEWYISAEIAQHERDAIFGQTWQFIGRVDQLTKSGDYITAQIAGEPIIVIRSDDGQLRGFYNVCRHRAAAILTEPCGHATKLRCRYHGWTYDLTGKLRGTPEFDGVENFCKDDFGLPTVQVDTMGPFVFVHLDSANSTSLHAQYQPFVDWLSITDVASLTFARRVEYTVPCNWKVFVDNYLDGGYHINTVHPALAGVLDYSEYKIMLFDRCSVQTSPLVPGEPNDAATQTRTGSEAAYWWLYPNMMVNHYAKVMDTNWVLPLSADQCRVVFDYYFAESCTPEFIEQSIAVAHQVQMEDEGVCRDVQTGLKSRSYRTGRFSVKRETSGYQFHQLLAQSFRSASC